AAFGPAGVDPGADDGPDAAHPARDQVGARRPVRGASLSRTEPPAPLEPEPDHFLGGRVLGSAAAWVRGVALGRALDAVRRPRPRGGPAARQLRAPRGAPARVRPLSVPGAARRHLPAVLPGHGARQSALPSGARGPGSREREFVGYAPSDLPDRSGGGGVAVAPPLPGAPDPPGAEWGDHRSRGDGRARRVRNAASHVCRAGPGFRGGRSISRPTARARAPFG